MAYDVNSLNSDSIELITVNDPASTDIGKVVDIVVTGFATQEDADSFAADVKDGTVKHPDVPDGAEINVVVAQLYGTLMVIIRWLLFGIH